MKLILTRHAKSAWDDPTIEDHDRVLNARGQSSAENIGHWLAQKGHLPELALCSTASRAAQTWELMRKAAAPDCETQYERALYLASPDTIMGRVTLQSRTPIIVIAHNPGMGQLMGGVVRQPPQHPDFNRCPTGATLVVEFEADSWSKIQPRQGRVLDYIVPRDLG